MVYAICKPEADARQITDADFGRAMAGEVIDAAATVLLEELASFFGPERRRVLEKAIRKMELLRTKVLQKAETMIDSPLIESRLEAELARIEPGSLSGAALESSASTPAPSNSVN